MQILAVLAGVGYLPVEMAKSAKNLGFKVVSVALVPGVEAELEEVSDVYYEISVMKLGKVLKTLQSEKVNQAIMIGKVTKELLYSKGAVLPDLKAIKFLATLPDRKDDTITKGLVDELHKIGVEVLDQTVLVEPILVEAGVLSKRKPTASEEADMDFGLEMARAIGRYDIGQTVVVKNLAVMAVEAIEGTDACVKRGCLLAKKDAIVAKTAKPAQDNRFDMPTVGLETMKSIAENGGLGIVMEAKRTFFIERKQALEYANKHKLLVVAK